MSITNVERSFGELLAAFGDLVVARTRALLESSLGGPLTAEPLLAGLRRAG